MGFLCPHIAILQAKEPLPGNFSTTTKFKFVKQDSCCINSLWYFISALSLDVRYLRSGLSKSSYLFWSILKSSKSISRLNSLLILLPRFYSITPNWSSDKVSIKVFLQSSTSKLT